MKKNKYRWREMKDDKPDVGEFIFISHIKHWKGEPLCYPYRVQYLGKCEWEGSEDSNLIIVREFQLKTEEPITNIIRPGNYVWRKMCKLPGEE